MAEAASILLVDDDVAIRDSITQILQDEGYQVTGAASGLDALAFLRASDAPPCLILLDLAMPVMDGWEFRRTQVGDPQLHSIPVVVLTADGRARQKAEELNADGFLEKPLSFDRLLNTVGRYCSR